MKQYVKMIKNEMFKREVKELEYTLKRFDYSIDEIESEYTEIESSLKDVQLILIGTKNDGSCLYQIVNDYDKNEMVFINKYLEIDFINCDNYKGYSDILITYLSWHMKDYKLSKNSMLKIMSIEIYDEIVSELKEFESMLKNNG